MKNSIAKLLVIFSFSFLMTGLLYAEFNPNGGENGEFWSQNTTRTIKWDTSYFHNTVNIYLWNMTSATFTTIDTSIQASLGEYDWVIPSNHPTGLNFRVKIQQPDSAIYQFSETFFPIYEGSSPHSEVSEKPNEKDFINIIPNPASNKITIELHSEFTSNAYISIFDCLGNELLEQNTSGKRYEFDCSALPNGIYFCVVRAGSKAYSGKFVVVK